MARNYKRRGSRYRARRRAVDILFEAETRDVDPVSVVEDRIELASDPQNAVAPVAEYTREIVSGVAETLDDLDDAVERYMSREWVLDRLPAVDRQILRVGAWEILFNDEVGPAIAITNALEMAEEYAGESAPPYIHAVLDDVAQSVAANAPAVDQAPAADSDVAPHSETGSDAAFEPDSVPDSNAVSDPDSNPDSVPELTPEIDSDPENEAHDA